MGKKTDSIVKVNNKYAFGSNDNAWVIYLVKQKTDDKGNDYEDYKAIRWYSSFSTMAKGLLGLRIRTSSYKTVEELKTNINEIYRDFNALLKSEGLDGPT